MCLDVTDSLIMSCVEQLDELSNAQAEEGRIGR